MNQTTLAKFRKNKVLMREKVKPMNGSTARRHSGATTPATSTRGGPAKQPSSRHDSSSKGKEASAKRR